MAKDKQTQGVDGEAGQSVAARIITQLCYAVTGTGVAIVGHCGPTRGDYTPEQVIAQFEVEVGDLPDTFQTAGGESKSLKAYGICGLLQDRSSQEKGPDAKFKAMLAEAQRLASPGALWSVTKERAAKASTPKVDPILVAVIAELKKVTVAEAQANLASLDKDVVAKLKANPKVAELYAAKEAEVKAAQSAESTLDLADLLSE
jgi:hypothetical protein